MDNNSVLGQEHTTGIWLRYYLYRQRFDSAHPKQQKL